MNIMKPGSAEEVELRAQMRKLWEERTGSEKTLIAGLIEELDTSKKTHKDLLKIHRDIGTAIGKYFKDASIPEKTIKNLMDQESYTDRKLTPEEKKLITRYTAGVTLRAMLDHQIQHIVNYVLALKNHDMPMMDDAGRNYCENTASIAFFLSGLNALWTEEKIGGLLHDLESAVRAYMNARLAEEPGEAGEAWEKALKISTGIADALTDGIVKETETRGGKAQS